MEGEGEKFLPQGTPGQRLRRVEAGRGAAPTPSQNPIEVQAVGQLLEQKRQPGAAERFFNWARRLAAGQGGHETARAGQEPGQKG